MNYVICVYAVVACLYTRTVSQTASQAERCNTHLRFGGSCVDLRANCPDGSEEFPSYSNYLGCNRVDRKCCGATQGEVKNKTGIIPSGTCGLGSLEPSSRILNGLLTGPCDVPFIVSIRAQISSSTEMSYDSTSHACQGVLIAKQWVLTSGPCIISAGDTAEGFPYRALIVAADYNVSGADFDPVTGDRQEQIIRASSVHMHPNYRYRSQMEIIPFNDTKGINSNAVALIKLEEPIKARCAGIACLPTATEAANKCAPYDDCIITGWGFSTENFQGGLRDELLFGKVRLTSADACDFLTQRMGLTSSRSEGTICQSPVGRNTDSCLGDEGGAVLCSNGLSWVVRGILPFNICLDGRFNLYVTDVASYLPWIQETMASFGG